MAEPLRDVSDWEIVDPNKGSRRGYWLRAPDGRRGLLKIPEEHKRGSGRFVRAEAGAEFLAYLVGNQLGLPVPEVEVVRFREGSEEHICSLAWDFCAGGYELREGLDLTGSVADARHIPIAEARDRLARYLGRSEAQRHVICLVCFDILIANPDRHQRNWGVLVSASAERSPRMAPYYDNGSAFGSNLEVTKIIRHLQQGWDSFDSGFRYEMPVGAGPYGRIGELLEEMRRWDARLAGLPRRLEALDDDIIEELVSRVHDEAMESERKEFARRLLIHRRDLILGR